MSAHRVQLGAAAFIVTAASVRREGDLTIRPVEAAARRTLQIREHDWQPQ
jgi:hypothetical protein